uniref:Mpv17-like protein 2 n=1 Tax=Oncorhynchus tshawytscha TaxID=74940 RepID=A0A8C8GVR3_ONCTS
MIPQSSREFLVKITGYWKPFFNSMFLIVTNTVSCGGMLAAGNIIQQTRKKWRVPERACDWVACVAVGCSMGPFMRYLYQWLDNLFLSAIKKVLTDQLIGSVFKKNSSQPIVLYISALIPLKVCLCSFSFKVDWCVWPMAQVINFYFLPPKFRVFYVRCSQGTRNVVWGIPNKHVIHSQLHISVLL